MGTFATANREIPEFRPGLAADQAHLALKTSVAIMNRAQHCAVLWFAEIMRRERYRELGFSRMRAYALEELGFSPTRAGDFVRLARKLDELPAVQQEMAAGKLGDTKARVIASVADPSNEKGWLKVARSQSRRALAATVHQARAVAKRRRKVLARDRHRCRRRGCPHSRYLHLHHITPRTNGGGNDPDNHVALCPACHDLWHRQGGHLKAMLRPT